MFSWLLFKVTIEFSCWGLTYVFSCPYVMQSAGLVFYQRFLRRYFQLSFSFVCIDLANIFVLNRNKKGAITVATNKIKKTGKKKSKMADFNFISGNDLYIHELLNGVGAGGEIKKTSRAPKKTNSNNNRKTN